MSVDAGADGRADCPECGAHVQLRSSRHNAPVTRWCFVCCTASLFSLS